MELRDPLRAFKFSAEFPGIGTPIGLIEVSGLRHSPNGGALLLTRGVCLGAASLTAWKLSGDTRDLDITVDAGIVFHVRGAKPTDLTYNDLDAGGETRYILLEYLRVSYDSIAPEFV